MAQAVQDIISAKRERRELTRDQIEAMVCAFLNGGATPAQMAAWLMAVVLNGMTDRETSDLTDVMLHSGETLDLSQLPQPCIDKHSTGGVGDKTSIVVVPMLAACGVTVVKMSGRGLGFSGGTVDKLESIPGFQAEMETEQMLRQAAKIGACLVSQSRSLAPADKAIYALRDTTATVESLPLIASSIMSKKLAAGAHTIVLDVKTGSGSFMPTVDEARKLAHVLVTIGVRAGRRMSACITDMNEPLGDSVGNALEIAEAVRTLTPGASVSGRFRTLCVELCAHALVACAKSPNHTAARTMAEGSLANGAALDKFRAIVDAQGGDASVINDLTKLPMAQVSVLVKAEDTGFIQQVNTAALGHASVALGAGRTHPDDRINPAVGLEVHAHIGDEVAAGGPLTTIHAATEQAARSVEESVRSAFTIGRRFVDPPPLIYDTIDEF